MEPEVKTRFPRVKVPSRFPLAKEADVDKWPVTIEEMVMEKHTQQDAQYQNTPNGSKRCFGCSKFDGPNSCFGIDGIISLNGYCKYYEEQKGLGLPVASNLTSNLPQSGVKKYGN